MGIKTKIYYKKVLSDSQVIYVMGWIKAYEFYHFYKEFNSQAFMYNWCDQQQAHFAMRKAHSYYSPELVTWLRNNNSKNVCWIDPNIFKAPRTDETTPFEWGIGFKKDDPLESWFVLRWT